MQNFGQVPPLRYFFEHSAELAAGAGETFQQDGITGQYLFVTSLAIYVATAVPTNQVIPTITDVATGRVVWREVIAAGAPIGTRVGWIRDTRPLQLSQGGAYLLTVPASGGACQLIVNTDGFAAFTI